MKKIIIPRKFFLLLTVLLLSCSCAALKVKDLNAKVQSTDILKGTIMHIFEDFGGTANARQKIVKTKIDSEPEQQELSLLEINKTNVSVGNKILIAKLDSSHNYGLGDSFEDKLIFIDFARDQHLFWLLFPVIFLLFFANRTARFSFGALAANVFLLLVLLPFFINFRISILLFVIIFLIANSYLGKYFFNSDKYNLALATTIPMLLLTALSYNLFNYLAKIDEYEIISNNILMSTINNLPGLDIAVIVVAGFFLYLFTSLFFISQTYRQNLYTNFSNAVWKISLLYFLLFCGFSLPTLMFFFYNGLGAFQLFNYLPFVQLLVKFMFLFWGNLFCCIFYLSAFYLKYRQHFEKFMKLPTIKENTRNMGQTIDLTAVISDKKENKYNESVAYHRDLKKPAPRQKPIKKTKKTKNSYFKRIAKIGKKKTLLKKLQVKKKRRR